MTYSNLSSNFYIPLKYIICDYASDDWGTGDCITSINNEFQNVFGNRQVYEYSYIGSDHSPHKEYISVFCVKDTKVAIVDYVEVYNENRKTQILKQINNTIKPDIIICNSLSWGRSLDAVKSLAKDGDYRLILFRNFLTQNFSNKMVTQILNETNAESLVDLISKLPMYMKMVIK